MSALDIEKELGKLTRYDHRGALMDPDQTGDYLLVSDVRDLLAAHVSGQGGEDDERAIMRAVIAHLEKNSSHPHAPGHCHRVPGVWDLSNRPEIAGKACEWCALWAKFKAIAATQSKEAVNG